ncbi:hypothetical protein VCHENC02_0979A, partial [Vibrio harveyi]
MADAKEAPYGASFL